MFIIYMVWSSNNCVGSQHVCPSTISTLLQKASVQAFHGTSDVQTVWQSSTKGWKNGSKWILLSVWVLEDAGKRNIHGSRLAMLHELSTPTQFILIEMCQRLNLVKKEKKKRYFLEHIFVHWTFLMAESKNSGSKVSMLHLLSWPVFFLKGQKQDNVTPSIMTALLEETHKKLKMHN